MEMFKADKYPAIKLKEAFELRMGKTPTREIKRYWDSMDYKWVSIADLSAYSRYTCDTKEYISQAAVDETGIKIIPKNTVIMSFKLTIGKTAITSEPIYTNEAIMAFLPQDNKFVNEYLQCCLEYKDWNSVGKQAVKGVTLNKESIGEAQILMPPRELQEQFAAIVRQTDKSKLLVKAQILHLFEGYCRMQTP